VENGDQPLYRRCIDPIWDQVTIYEGPEQFLRGFAAIPAPLGDLYAAHWIVSEVRNGALPQFFSNSTGVLAPEAVQALRRLGLNKAADATESAMTFFGEAYPRDRETRSELIDWVWNQDMPEEDRNNLDIFLGLTDEFLDEIGNDGVDFIKAANEYAKAHCSAV
jgi:Domain of unknown function (DUF4375)